MKTIILRVEVDERTVLNPVDLINAEWGLRATEITLPSYDEMLNNAECDTIIDDMDVLYIPYTWLLNKLKS